MSDAAEKSGKLRTGKNATELNHTQITGNSVENSSGGQMGMNDREERIKE